MGCHSGRFGCGLGELLWGLFVLAAGGLSLAGEKETSVDLGGGVKMDFVLIRPGTFTMGDKVYGPAHKVTLTKPFYLGKYEVTQEQWQAVMGANFSWFKGAKNPVDSVSWDDCQDFLRKLNEKLPGHGFRLPTEAEWEYACRAGSTTKYSFGESGAALGEYAWYGANSGRRTHPVGEKKPNAWGLYGMHGNVWEWCQDTCARYQAGEQTDPVGVGGGGLVALRGGSWYLGPEGLRSANRYFNDPANRDSNHGSRMVLVPGPR